MRPRGNAAMYRSPAIAAELFRPVDRFRACDGAGPRRYHRRLTDFSADAERDPELRRCTGEHVWLARWQERAQVRDTPR